MAKTRLYKTEESAAAIGANSAVFANGDLVALSAGFLIKAINTTVAPLVGVSNYTGTMGATNQTVEKYRVNFTRLEPYDTRFEYEASAALAQADVGKFYALTAAGIVDQATGNAAKQASSVVRLEDIKSGTTGIFVAVI